MEFTATATTKAGRNGHVDSSDGVLNLDLGMPGSNKPHATNPEQLFAAGYSACFGGAIMAVAGAGKLKPEAVHVTAEVTLHAVDGDYSISVKLKPRIDGLDRAQAEALMHKAHEVCPYSKATRNNIKVDLELA